LAKPLRVSDVGDWGQWLAVHREAYEVWLTIRKKGSRRPGVGIEEAIEEAIAYGWIDSRMRHLDTDEYLLRFTPRRDNSSWSLRNRRIAERLLAEGRMKEVGLTCIEAAKLNHIWDSVYSSLTPPNIPGDLEEALRSSGQLDRFKSMSNSTQPQYVFRIDQAKKP
jgi:uncharacterized protein YdeI (YjbR/CyaY-like superfamily)